MDPESAADDKFFIMLQNAAKSGINEIGIGLRISGRTFTHTSDKKVRPAHHYDIRPAHCLTCDPSTHFYSVCCFRRPFTPFTGGLPAHAAVACHVLPAMRCHASSHSAAVASSTHRFPSRRKSYWGLAISPRVSGGRAP
jgi:hypothetical protein